jgi:hypothetical protein
MQAASFPPPYEARRPTESILYQTLAGHLATFIDERERELCPLPKYVRDELEAYLHCGIHHYGFLRVRCPKGDCGFEHAVPFSCKKRAFCSSCFAKRAAEIEEHLTEDLLPRVPYRQYVLTFPHSLRYRLAWDGDLLAVIHKAVIDRIYRFIRDSLSIKFKRKDLRPGSVSFIQRCGSLLNLNLHFHLLVMDGAYICRENKRSFFHKIPDPSDQDIAELLESIIEAVELCLHKRGLLDDESEIPEELKSIEAASRASVAQKIAFGERRGQRVRRIGFRREGDALEFKGPQCIALAGFSLHAARRVGSEERRNLSQLINYMARPPIAEARLEKTPSGDILYKLKEPWNDGTAGIQLSPSELIEKLIALIPPRSSPLVRYGGVFAPNFKRRDEIILVPGRRKRKVSLKPGGAEKSEKSQVTSGSWARLLKRVFAIDVSRCPRCKSELEIIAAVLDPKQIARYLKHTGMPAAPPARAGVKMRVVYEEWT